MAKVKIKVKAKPGAARSGTLIARVPVTVAQAERPKGEMLYQTKAQLITRIERGKRPKTTRLKRSR